MAGEEIVQIGSGDLEGEVRRELDHHLGCERQRRYRRFLLAALGGVPWVGGFIAATAAIASENEQSSINELQQQWLEEHRGKLSELSITLAQVVEQSAISRS
jgi:hypothetical protein